MNFLNKREFFGILLLAVVFMSVTPVSSHKTFAFSNANEELVSEAKDAGVSRRVAHYPWDNGAGMLFAPGVDEVFTNLPLMVMKSATSLGNGLYVKIYTLGRDNLIATSNLFPKSEIPLHNDYTWAGINLSEFTFDTPVLLDEGTTYTFMVYAQGGSSSSGANAYYVLYCATAVSPECASNAESGVEESTYSGSSDEGAALAGSGSSGRYLLTSLERPVAITSNIASSTTWTSNHTYVVVGDVAIEAGATLTIEAGAVVKFDTATSSSLTVEGTLDALGDRDDYVSGWNPVVFTSIEDDNIGNPPDTTGNGSTTSPVAGDWGGIKINTGGVANILGAIVRYAGLGSGAGIYNDGGRLTIASSTVALNDTYGIYNESGTTTARFIDLSFQDYGLYLEDGSAEITATSTIHDNSLYGIYNDSASSINAEGNYWATSTGPSVFYGSEVYGPVDYIDFIENLYYVDPTCTPAGSSCASVIDRELLYNASTTYATELDASIATWDSENEIEFIATSTDENLFITDVRAEDFSDVPWKGRWRPDEISSSIDLIELNPYYLETDSFSERQNTITHELGHALGLLHSYTGNVLYYNQNNQTSLGPQDVTDYHYLWQ